MKNILKKFLLKNSFWLLIVPLLSTCASATGVPNGKFVINLKLSFDGNPGPMNLQKMLNKKLATYKKMSLFKQGNIKEFQVKIVDDDKTILQNLTTNKAQLGITTSFSLYYSDLKNFVTPKIQTLTKAFLGNETVVFYNKNKDNQLSTEIKTTILKSNDLKKNEINKSLVNNNEISLTKPSQSLWDTTQKMNYYFTTPPYKDWNKPDDPKKWKDFIYSGLYNENKLVNFYQGMIMFKGDKTKWSNLINAWNQKNWTSFLKEGSGFAGGLITSAGKYALQEKILLKHFFGLKNTTLQQELTKNNLSYKEAQAQNLGSDANKNNHLFFDDAASYAWTRNKLTLPGGENAFYTAKNNEVRLFLITEPLLYDIGSFTNKINYVDQSIVTKMFLDFAKEKVDPYGPSYGYNGYQEITNVNSQVYNFMNKTLK